MNAWLYPISKRSGYVFSDDRGHHVRTSYESFRDFVVTGEIRDDSWKVHNNFDRAAPGDEVLIYTGDSDRGIIGRATIRSKVNRRRRILIDLDVARTRLLLAQPVPASAVRKLIPPPRTGLLSLSSAMPALAKMLPWSATYDTRSKELLAPLRLRPVRFVFARHRQATTKKWLRHDTVLGPVRVYLKGRGFELGTRTLRGLRTDMVAVSRKETIVVEAKMIQEGEGRLEAREGLGQALEYAWLLQLACGRARPAKLWLAFSARPSADVAAFLDAQGAIVSWTTKRGLSFFDPEKCSGR